MAAKQDFRALETAPTNGSYSGSGSGVPRNYRGEGNETHIVSLAGVQGARPIRYSTSLICEVRGLLILARKLRFGRPRRKVAAERSKTDALKYVPDESHSWSKG